MESNLMLKPDPEPTEFWKPDVDFDVCLMLVESGLGGQVDGGVVGGVVGLMLEPIKLVVVIHVIQVVDVSEQKQNIMTLDLGIFM